MMSKTIQLITLSTLLMFTGCGSKNVSHNVAPTIYQNSATYGSPSIDEVASAPLPAKRIVTQRANISVDVENINQAKDALLILIEKHGGHIVTANLYEKRYNASAKVPSTKLMETLNEIATLGEKTAQSISQNDVTTQFVDNEARLKNLLLFRDKMKALLNRTSNIEEIVKIERELRRVQTEIDSIEGRQKYLKDAIALTPIGINFKEKRVYGPLGYIAHGIWWVTKKLFIIK